MVGLSKNPKFSLVELWFCWFDPTPTIVTNDWRKDLPPGSCHLMEASNYLPVPRKRYKRWRKVRPFEEFTVVQQSTEGDNLQVKATDFYLIEHLSGALSLHLRLVPTESRWFDDRVIANYVAKLGEDELLWRGVHRSVHCESQVLLESRPFAIQVMVRRPQVSWGTPGSVQSWHQSSDLAKEAVALSFLRSSVELVVTQEMWPLDLLFNGNYNDTQGDTYGVRTWLGCQSAGVVWDVKENDNRGQDITPRIVGQLSAVPGRTKADDLAQYNDKVVGRLHWVATIVKILKLGAAHVSEQLDALWTAEGQSGSLSKLAQHLDDLEFYVRCNEEVFHNSSYSVLGLPEERKEELRATSGLLAQRLELAWLRLQTEYIKAGFIRGRDGGGR